MSKSDDPAGSAELDGFEGLEARLRRYRPSAPPASLRARIVAAERRARREWLVWVPAAAVVLLTIVLQVWTSSTYRRIESRVDAGRVAERNAVIERTAEALGGGDDARREAEWLAAQGERDAAAAPVAGSALEDHQ